MSTFARVNAVQADPNQSRVRDLYLDAGFTSGTYASNIAQPLQTQASSGVCYRGMPIAVASSTGALVPVSASGSTYVGVLLDDITPFVVATGRKRAFVTSGRVRTYAAGTLTIGDHVKVDTSAGFSGFSKWIDGTDDPNLRVGTFFPVAENGTGAVAGDTIFVDLF